MCNLEAFYSTGSSGRPHIKRDCSHFFLFFLFFTFEQEIVLIVSVPHSGRGRSDSCPLEKMTEEYGCEMSFYARKYGGGRFVPRLCASFDSRGELAADGRAANSAEGGEESLHREYLPPGGALYWHAVRERPAFRNLNEINILRLNSTILIGSYYNVFALFFYYANTGLFGLK